MSRKTDNNSLNRIMGCMVGGAVGDALGYAVEFKRWPQIVVQHGERGITRFEFDSRGLAPVSDDTQMSLFTAAALLVSETRSYTWDGVTNRFEYYCRYSYRDWLHTQLYPFGTELKSRCSWLMDVPELYNRRAPGNTCLSALMDMEHNREVDNTSCGCGGVMRTAPIALYAFRHMLLRREKIHVDDMAARAARLTHKHPLGFIPSAILNHILMEILEQDASTGEQLECIVRKALESLHSTISVQDNDKTYGELWAKYIARQKFLIDIALSRAHTKMPDQLAIEMIGGGWTGHEALAIAIYSAIKHADSFEEAIISSVNHSGDSDSTGAICGNIMGCLLGRKAIPGYFTDNLELLPVIEELSIDIYNGCPIDELDCSSTPEKRRWYDKYILCKTQVPADERYPSCPDNEITPEHLRKWYREALDDIGVSYRLRRNIDEIPPDAILGIFAHYIEIPFGGWDIPYEVSNPAQLDEVIKIQKSALEIVSRHICNWPRWEPEKVADYPLNERQYAVLLKGYNPHWDDRYATYCQNGWFYLYRSGNVLKKFKYEKRSDGFWAITVAFTTNKTKGFDFDLIGEMYYHVIGEEASMERERRGRKSRLVAK